MVAALLTLATALQFAALVAGTMAATTPDAAGTFFSTGILILTMLLATAAM